VFSVCVFCLNIVVARIIMGVKSGKFELIIGWHTELIIKKKSILFNLFVCLFVFL
jgi:hypothetical protein